MKKIKCVVLGAADAGKTSLLRRYFYHSFQGTRLPTVGSDFYTRKVTVENGYHNNNNNDNPSTTVLLHMWDTPGRERQRQEEEEHVDALLDAFVGRVDGLLLVYDSSSSTSFTKLRLIYAHWLLKDKDRDNCSSSQIPILVVGNKRDLSYTSLKKQQKQKIPASVPEDQENHNNHKNTSTDHHHHRNVMGLEHFKGKDFRYEYKVYHDVPHSNSNSNSEINPTTANSNKKQQKQQQEDSNRHRHEIISTFSSTAGGGSMWTQDFAQDGSTYYLDSLLSSEDRSNPDRDMVKLWCMRNGLQHVEVSALEPEPDGGVDEAVNLLLTLVLEYQERQQTDKEQQQQQQPEREELKNHEELTAATVIQPREELDLHKRYGPTDNDKCCFGILPSMKVIGRWIVAPFVKAKRQ